MILPKRRRQAPSRAATAAAAALILLASAAVLAASAPLAAHAHPYIEETIPNTDQNAQAGTDEVIVFFSEAVDIEFSEIRVIDDSGERIDNRDLKYHQDDESLAISTPPLQDGVYTVSTKVLSKVDGHLVPGVFLFGVGDVVIDSELLKQEMTTEILFLPEAGAEFPGLLGQTIIVGAAVSALAVWGAHARAHAARGGVAGRRGGGGATTATATATASTTTTTITDGGESEFAAAEESHHKRFMQVTGAGLLLVLASNMAVIILQMSRLESGLVETVQTQFGMIWLARMAITVALFGVWFVASRAAGSRRMLQYAMLAAALALMMTSSMSGHGAATETAEAVALDYIHNVVAGVWIGGIIYIAFGLLPALSGCTEAFRERISLASIPKFSAIFIVAVGIVIVTGPTLLWTLESDVSAITESVYGRLIILKIAIAAAMIGMGWLIQRRIQKRAEARIAASKGPAVYDRLKRTLKLDVALGIAVLAVVALLTNGTLPAGEIQDARAQDVFPGFVSTEFADSVRFDIEISPFGTGDNRILVAASNADGSTLDDLVGVKVKASNPGRGIPPITIDMEEVLGRTGGPAGAAAYGGDLTLAFSGMWLLEVEAQKTRGANEAIRIDLDARPRLAHTVHTVTEYDMPNGTSPLHAAYHPGTDTVWFTDASEPRLWEADAKTGILTPHEFEGAASSFIAYSAHDGRIWFTDSRGGQIGHLDPRSTSGGIETIKIPDFASRSPTADPSASGDAAMPFFIEAGPDGTIWFSVINKALIARYDPQAGVFAEIPTPGRDPFPFALAAGPDGMMWYTATGTGTVGYVDPADNTLAEVLTGIEAPEALLFEDASSGGGLWITEHTGLAVLRYDTILGTIQRYEVSDPDALPFGMAFDRYGNIWFAQHTIDKIGVLDPGTGEIAEVGIPTATSFVQFLEADGDGDIWFAEQRGGKIGVLSASERPGSAASQPDSGPQDSYDIRYADLASPLMALGVLAASLFYVKAVRDGRRLDGLASRMWAGAPPG